MRAMITSSNKIEGLRQKILAAFPKIAPPLPENLTEHRCDECDGVRDDFSGVEWWSADNTLIDENYDDLPLFTPEAFHYYLPAFLLRSLDSFDPDNEVLQFSVYGLSPTKTPVDAPRYRARLNLFTPEQNSAVASFLEQIQMDERFYNYYADVERGLGKFWHAAKDDSAI
jgi:hypothetical protein